MMSDSQFFFEDFSQPTPIIDNENIQLTGKAAIFAAFNKPPHGSSDYWLVYQGYSTYKKIQEKWSYPNVWACDNGMRFDILGLRQELRKLGNIYRRGGKISKRKQKNSQLAPWGCLCGKRFWFKTGLFRHSKAALCQRAKNQPQLIVDEQPVESYIKQNQNNISYGSYTSQYSNTIISFQHFNHYSDEECLLNNG